MKKIKHLVVQLLIGNYYTEKEVKDVLSKMQYDMAQNVIKDDKFKTVIVPFDYWREHNGKYDTNLYKL